MNDQYQAPESQSRPSAPQADNTASLGKRLLAFVLDGFFMLMALMMVMQSMGLLEPASSQDVQAVQAELQKRLTALSDSQKMMLAVSPFPIFFLLHGFLLHQYGQTLGKRIVGIAIVTMDNRKPAFGQLILWRYLSQWMVGQVPLVGVLLRFIDIVAIFRPDHRCIHDHLAKTKVIDLKIPVAAVDGKPTSIIV
ncbi:MAG TPA: RDD family protein [Cellvibrio sp.]|nr:RDD family protein [Cellvibrio sp.]